MKKDHEENEGTEHLSFFAVLSSLIKAHLDDLMEEKRNPSLERMSKTLQVFDSLVGLTKRKIE